MNLLFSFRRCATLLFFVLFALSSAVFAEDIKQISPTGYVTDLAGVLTPETRARLEALCKEVQDKTGAQIAVVTVRSLDGESVENYAVDLFHNLGVGSKKDDRGVLLLLAPNDRKYRIEVGYGLEPVITDARAGDAGRAMVPSLRQGNFNQAVELAAWQLAKDIADVAGVALTGRPPARRAARNQNEIGFPAGFLILGVILLFLFLSAISRGGGAGTSGSGCLWFLLGMFMDNITSGSRGGWGSGGFGGSGDSGGSDGGGFGGFGGGDSGGGGASGDW